jgi:hypothetical protein
MDFFESVPCVCHLAPVNLSDLDGIILGMYGLDARTLDLSGYANDISLEQLMAHQPGVSVKPEIRRPVMNNNFFGAHANPSLHNLARPLQEETPAPFICTAKPIDSKPHRLMLDLEAPPMDETEEIALHDMSNAKVFFIVLCVLPRTSKDRYLDGLIMCNMV